MKSMNDNSNNNNNEGSENDNNNQNWLGFSLSPHMKMEQLPSPPAHLHHQHHHPPSVSTSFCLSPSQLTPYGLCYGAPDNTGFHPPLTVMPLKSDGSLCIMEALTRSQTQVMMPNSSPKLEDFLGGATMGSHDAMSLSLDSIYNGTQYDTQSQQTHRDHSLDFLSEPFRQDPIHVHPQHHTYYSPISCHPPIYPSPPLEQQQNKDHHMQHMSSEEGMACLKNWAVHQQGVQQKKNASLVSLGEEEGGASGSVGKVGCGDFQSLGLSVSPGSQSSCVTAPQQISPPASDVAITMEAKKRGAGKMGQKQPVHRKSLDTFGQRTSQYRGVTRHRWTGRYEAHLWDNSCKKEGQTRKGRQVYLGGYDMEEKAAKAYDLAALKYWGPSTHINFPLEKYQVELEEMKNMSRQEYVAHLRRKSSGFSRGASIYRGVTRHHQHGRWQARIGRVAGNKDLYLGTFSTQEEAAEAYDIAAIKFRGVNAVTNFDISRYDVERIMASNTLLAGDMARRNKDEPRMEAIEYNVVASNNVNEPVQQAQCNNNNNNEAGSKWKMLYASPNSCEQKTINCGNYRNTAISVALQDLIGIDSANNSGQGMLEDTTKIGTRFSNPSSLVTSQSSSREESPDKTGPTILFPKQQPSPIGSKIVSPIGGSNNGVGSWFPSGASQNLRPGSALSMSHLPVFAAWNDS